MTPYVGEIGKSYDKSCPKAYGNASLDENGVLTVDSFSMYDMITRNLGLPSKDLRTDLNGQVSANGGEVGAIELKDVKEVVFT